MIGKVLDGLLTYALPLTYTTIRDQQVGVCSGFLLQHRGIFWWVTAGHVMDDLHAVRREYGDKVLLGWVDSSGDGGRIPIEIDDLLIRTLPPVDGKGADLSVTYLSGHECRLLLRGPKKALISSSTKRQRGGTLLGYLIVGSPKGGVSSTKTNVPSGLRVEVEAGSTLVPIARIRRKDEDGPFWGCPGAFFGRVLEFDHFLGLTESIEGMSGGPIFAIELFGRYYRPRLVAIQSRQAVSQRLIRATPIRWLTMYIDIAIRMLRRKGISIGPVNSGSTTEGR